MASAEALQGIDLDGEPVHARVAADYTNRIRNVRIRKRRSNVKYYRQLQTSINDLVQQSISTEAGLTNSEDETPTGVSEASSTKQFRDGGRKKRKPLRIIIKDVSFAGNGNITTRVDTAESPSLQGFGSFDVRAY